MNTDSVRSVEQLLRRIPFFVSDYNLKLFQFNTQVFNDRCTYKSFRVPGYVNLKQTSRLKTNGYFTKNYKLLVCDLEQQIYEQGNWKIFFCFCVFLKKLCNCLCRCFSFCSSPQYFLNGPLFLVHLIDCCCMHKQQYPRTHLRESKW